MEGPIGMAAKCGVPRRRGAAGRTRGCIAAEMGTARLCRVLQASCDRTGGSLGWVAAGLQAASQRAISGPSGWARRSATGRAMAAPSVREEFLAALPVVQRLVSAHLASYGPPGGIVEYLEEMVEYNLAGGMGP